MLRLARHSIIGLIVGGIIYLLFTALLAFATDVIGLIIGSFFGAAVAGFIAARNGKLENVVPEGAKIGLINAAFFIALCIFFPTSTKIGSHLPLLGVISFFTSMLGIIFSLMESMIGAFVGIWISTWFRILPPLLKSATKYPEYLETKTKLMKKELRKHD